MAGLETKLKKKVREDKHFPRPIIEKKTILPPEDLITYLAAFRRFSAISGENVGKALGVVDITRRENKQSPTSLREAQIYAETVGIEMTVTLKHKGFSVECPVFKEQND